MDLFLYGIFGLVANLLLMAVFLRQWLRGEKAFLLLFLSILLFTMLAPLDWWLSVQPYNPRLWAIIGLADLPGRLLFLIGFLLVRPVGKVGESR
jgi:hypothetical protein